MPNAVKECFCKLFAVVCKLFGAVGDGENRVQSDLTNKIENRK